MEIFLYGLEDERRAYQAAASAAGDRLRCSLRMAAAGSCDALLLPGGGDMAPWRYGAEDRGSLPPDPEQDWAELTLLREFIARGKPVLGICRGLQVINVFFSGTLCQDLPGHRAVHGIDRLHRVRTVPAFRDVLPEGIVNSSHHQAVDRLGEGLTVVQRAPDGTVEALCHRELPVWAVQWHPERLRGPYTKKGAVDGEAVFRLLQKKMEKCIDRNSFPC